MENFFSIVSTAIDSQSSKKTSNESVEAAANILDVTEEIGRTVASTLGKCSGLGGKVDKYEELPISDNGIILVTNYCLLQTLYFIPSIWFSLGDSDVIYNNFWWWGDLSLSINIINKTSPISPTTRSI